jgi:hypothetical protein
MELGRTWCLTGYVFHIHTGSTGTIYEVNCNGVWQDFLGAWSVLTAGETTHVQCGQLGEDLVYRHWQDGQPVPDWQYTRPHPTGWRQGYWYIFDRDSAPGTWIDNVRVEGTGAVGIDTKNWGSVKALFK